MKYLYFFCFTAIHLVGVACAPGETSSHGVNPEQSPHSSPVVSAPSHPTGSTHPDEPSTTPRVFGVWRFSGFACLGGEGELGFVNALNRVLQPGSSMVWEIQEDGNGLITGRLEGQTMPWQATQIFTFENDHQLRRQDISVLERDVVNPQNVRWAFGLRLALQRDVTYTFSVTETTLTLRQPNQSPVCPIYGPDDEDHPIGYREASFTFTRAP